MQQSDQSKKKKTTKIRKNQHRKTNQKKTNKQKTQNEVLEITRQTTNQREKEILRKKSKQNYNI